MNKLVGLITIVFTTSAFAQTPTVLGGRAMPGGDAHYVALGWPSIAYEWWNSGSPDWAVGGEIVYGDWSGGFSDVDIGFAINTPLRWNVYHKERTDIAFRLAPGALIGTADGGAGDDLVVGAIRADAGAPINVALGENMNLLTGATVPFSVLFVEDADPYVVIPILARLGLEIEVDESITPFLLIEAGPTMAFGDFGGEAEFGLRAFVGSVFF